MKFNKYTLVFACALSTGTLLAQAPVPAQDQGAAPAANAPAAAQGAPMKHRNADPAKQARKLGHKLGLSKDQVSQITPIIANRQQQMQSAFADTALTQPDRRARMQSIQQDSRAKIEAVLNDQQKQQFEQMLQARRNHHQQPSQAQ